MISVPSASTYGRYSESKVDDYQNLDSQLHILIKSQEETLLTLKWNLHQKASPFAFTSLNV